MNKIYFTRKHKIMEIISYVLLVLSFIIVVIAQKTLPARIPVRYDMAGKVLDYGSPVVLFFLPLGMLFCNLSISFVLHFVSIDFWNMPFKVKEERKIIVYRDVVSMMLWLEMQMAAFTLVYTIMSYVRKMDGVLALTILLIVLVTVTIIVYCILAARHNKKE